MKYVCGKDPDREITIPKVCQARNRNPNLKECYGCPGPILENEAVVRSIVNNKEENIPLLRSNKELPKIWG